MKKVLLFTVIILSLTSCYNSKVFHGTVTENTPQIEVASKSNPILLWGLLPLEKANQKASDNIGNKKNYTTKHTQTFVDGLLSCITFGIYTPTTTKYFLPIEEVNK